MIVEYVRLAEEFNVQLLVDEVYGLQVFSSRYVPDPTPFVSILSLDIQALAGCDAARVHVIVGPTKDFGASGLKLGSLISQHNPDLLLLVERAVQALPMSSASDALCTRLLSDISFRDWFLEGNRRRLRKAFEVVGDWCTYHKLPFVSASVGVFFVVDLAPVLGHVASEGANAYEQTIAGFNAGVYIVPMTISEDSIVTRYRMTFTLPPDTMLLFGALAAFSWAQCLYYGTHRSKIYCVVVYAAFLMAAGAFQGGLSMLVRRNYKKGDVWSVRSFSIISAVLLSVGLLPQY
ncbi:hypothetical protein FRC06_004249 [Ceratobasidium sp. 370]|nr:hypothetical protein FRC06_004249 [Ceratobasidium sp. 370]